MLLPPPARRARGGGEGRGEPMEGGSFQIPPKGPFQTHRACRLEGIAVDPKRCRARLIQFGLELASGKSKFRMTWHDQDQVILRRDCIPP